MPYRCLASQSRSRKQKGSAIRCPDGPSRVCARLRFPCDVHVIKEASEITIPKFVDVFTEQVGVPCTSIRSVPRTVVKEPFYAWPEDVTCQRSTKYSAAMAQGHS